MIRGLPTLERDDVGRKAAAGRAHANLKKASLLNLNKLVIRGISSIHQLSSWDRRFHMDAKWLAARPHLLPIFTRMKSVLELVDDAYERLAAKYRKHRLRSL
jgi:hypothetical protein